MRGDPQTRTLLDAIVYPHARGSTRPHTLTGLPRMRGITKYTYSRTNFPLSPHARDPPVVRLSLLPNWSTPHARGSPDVALYPLIP